MLNQVIVVGRLTTEPQKEEINGKVRSVITLAVSRNYKNVDGVYETDFINCILWSGISENVCEYCHKGDLIGIKGRLQTTDNVLQIVAEKVTSLSSKKEEESED